MKQQTALQKLKQKLYLIILSNNHSKEFELALESVIDDIDENFLKKEKEQIMEAYDKGSDVDDDLLPLYGTPEEYYNKTFGQGSPDTSSLNIKNK